MTSKFKPGDVVKFDDGRGNKITGTVQRTWGSRAVNVTIKTDEAKPRTFVRLERSVTK